MSDEDYTKIPVDPSWVLHLSISRTKSTCTILAAETTAGFFGTPIILDKLEAMRLSLRLAQYSVEGKFLPDYLTNPPDRKPKGTE